MPRFGPARVRASPGCGFAGSTNRARSGKLAKRKEFRSRARPLKAENREAFQLARTENLDHEDADFQRREVFTRQQRLCTISLQTYIGRIAFVVSGVIGNEMRR